MWWLSKATHQVCPRCLVPGRNVTLRETWSRNRQGQGWPAPTTACSKPGLWRDDGKVGARKLPFCWGASSSACLDRKRGTRQEWPFCLTQIFFLVASVAGLGPGTHLFAGPLVSVHLHHALAEDVKGVFFLLRPISSQALSF